jgi:hypothetical protein
MGEMIMAAPALETLLARQEITDLIHRYCRAMDRIDDDLGYSVWWPDATADYGAMFQGSGHGFVDFVHGPHQGFLASAHRVGNILIEIDGDAASSETYIEAGFCMPDGERGQRTARSAGRYLDRWSRRDGRWAIAHRQYLHDWDEGFAPGASMNPRTGRRDASDGSYAYVGQGGRKPLAASNPQRQGNRMTYRIALWGTGLVGAAAGRKIIDHPDLDLVACHAFTPAKVGQDVGALVGAADTGVKATGDIEAIVAAKPDCVLYVPLVWSVDDMVRLLAAGINVISTANYITGRSYGQEAVDRLEAAARQGGVSLYGTGINPGLLNIVALAVTAACGKVHKITARESVDATLYASKDTWVSLGFGGSPDAPGLAEQVKTRALVFVDAVEMMAKALKADIDDIGFQAEFATATQDLDLGWMDIAKGGVCGLQMTFSGLIKGKSVIDLQLMWRLGSTMTPDWKAEGYVVEIEGQPNARLTFEAKDPTAGGGTTTAMNAIHAIAAVCAARPGIVTAADLPLIVAAGCVEPR